MVLKQTSSNTNHSHPTLWAVFSFVFFGSELRKLEVDPKNGILDCYFSDLPNAKHHFVVTNTNAYSPLRRLRQTVFSFSFVSDLLRNIPSEKTRIPITSFGCLTPSE